MTAENKKTAMYLGGAIVVGAVGFFVYSFFQKPIVVGNTTVSLGNEEDKAPSITPTNPFKQMLAQSQVQGSSTPTTDYTKSLFQNIDWTKQFNNPHYNTGIK